jgi:hypothetical protein
VNALVDHGSLFRLYFNNTWSEPQAAEVQAGRWNVYRFSVPGRLTALRLDPSDEARAEVLVKSVTIRSGGASASVTGDALQHWLRTDLDVQFDAGAGVTRVSTRSRSGYMMGTVDIDVTHQTLPFLNHFRLNTITLLWTCFLAGTVLVLLSVRWSHLSAALGMVLVLAASVGLAYSVAHWLLTSPRFLAFLIGPASVSQTIGHQSYFGRPKAVDVRAVNGALLSAAAVALLLGFVMRRRSAGDSLADASGSRPLLKADVIFCACCIVAFAAGAVPPAVAMHAQALTIHHAAHFDAQNFLVWQYLYAHGSLPWRDYWFPYSGMYNQMAPLYPDLAFRWGHLVLLFAVLFVTSFVVTGRSRVAVLAFSSIWIYFEAMGVFTPAASGRYCLGLGVLLFGAVALEQPGMGVGVAWGLWMGYVFTQEISQFFYAVPGLGLLVVAALCCSHPKQARPAMLRTVVVAGLAFSVWVLILLGSLALNGQLPQWWQFVSTLDLISNYSAWPADIASWFSLPRTTDEFLVFVTIVTLAGGVLQAAWSRFRSVYLLLPAAIGCLGVMLLQKQIIRSGIAEQLLPVPILGLALLVFQQLQLRPAAYRSAAWTAFSAALIVTCFTLTTPVTRARLSAYLDVTSGLLPDLRDTLKAGREWSAARSVYFSPASMTLSQIRGDELSAEVQQLTGLEKQDAIFVLGDNPDLYLILQRPVAFHPNFYNQSPLAEQQRTLEWLRDHDPKYLFWDPQEKVFDDVPNPVRVPLLYNYAAAHFVPLGTIGKFEVLRRRLGNEPPDAAYWRDKLGTSLDLGYIPAASRALSDVDAHGGQHMRYLTVRLAAPEEGAAYAVALRLAGGPYTVRFKGRKGVAEYAIALDRLPLAAAGDEMGQPPVVESSPEGASASISTLRFSQERLY